MQRNLSKVTANYVKSKIIIWLFHNKCVNLHRISKLLWQIYLKQNSSLEAVMGECRALFEKKLHDYGASWRILRPSSLTDQLYIKAKRIRSLEIRERIFGWRRHTSGIHRPYSFWYRGVIIQLEKSFVDEWTLRQKRQ